MIGKTLDTARPDVGWGGVPISRRFSANLEAPVSLAPLTAEISMASCRLPDFHGDPADHIIVATAITLGIPLITADEKIIRWNEMQRLVQVIAL